MEYMVCLLPRSLANILNLGKVCSSFIDSLDFYLTIEKLIKFLQMDKPTYYTIIPAEVRYNKKISANEKVLYSEIFTLAQKNGTCFASNGFFAELYGVDKRSITRWISTLKEHNLIKISYHIKEGNVEKRIITPLVSDVTPPRQKRHPPRS